METKPMVTRTAFTLLLTLLSVIFTIDVAGQANEVGRPEMRDMRDETLLSKLSSADPAEVTRAAREIFRRGERMIPRLVKLKGDRTVSQFLSLCNSDPRSSYFSARVYGVEGSWVTTEVVALYLISAIYFENPRFAVEPLLQGSRPVKDYNYNTRKRLKKAWKSNLSWYSKFESVGIDELRKLDESPLSSSKLSFLNTDPKRSWRAVDCTD
jgi:hypothetical protein